MRYSLIVALASLLPAASFARAETAAGDDPPTFRLNVRVHLLTSREVPELNCTLSEEEVRELFTGVNDIWQQAGIVWEVELIVRKSAVEEMQPRFAKLVRNSKQVPRKLDKSEMRPVLRAIYSTEDELAGGWNLYVVEDLGKTIGGAYHIESQSILFAKNGPRGLQTANVLAHEFGHSLGLPHVPDSFQDNLMMGSSPLRSPKTSKVLVQQQIDAAQKQAAAGAPRDVSQRVQALFERNDADGDGAVSKNEAKSVFLHNFATYDANDDGRVELLELQSAFDKTVMPARQNSPAAVGQANAGRTEQVREMLRKRFAEADSNSDGRLSDEESRASARPVVPPPLFERNDQNNDGALDKDEFKLLLSGIRVGGTRTQRQPTRSVFDQYDQDSDGKLSKEEVGDAWGRIAPFDEDQDETIDQQEFANAQSKRSAGFKESFRQRFTEADANDDGKVTVAESKAGKRPLLPANLFERHDRDSNGSLDREEFDLFLAGVRVAILPSRGARGQRLGQRGDLDFDPKVVNPAYAEGQGPVVLVDESHFNYHTVDGRYAAFAKLVRRDGYVVQSNLKKFTRDVLDSARILVISNPLAEQNQGNWKLPTPSAFTEQEIAEVVKWVSDGGSLLLIADHMPFAGAAEELAAAFDVKFLNGFAMPEVRGGPMRFERDQGLLQDHSVTRGRNAEEKVDSVSTFTGSAFQVGGQFEPILKFGSGVTSLQPEVAWQFSEQTARENVEGWCQGAVGKFGKGRVAVFGEAAMFTAQKSGNSGRTSGMGSPEAAENGQLLLNTMHWLDGLLGR